jgi:hypothetical protein
MSETKLGCRNCGGSNIRAWYPVDEGQDIEITGLDEDGIVHFDFTGSTTSGEPGPDESYWCRDCDDNAITLEELLGLPRPKGAPRYTDAEALDELNLLLSAPEWPGASGMEDVCEIVRGTGRLEVKDAPTWERH